MESPGKRVGCSTLTPEEGEQIIRLLPDGRPKDALETTLRQAKARAQDLNDLDRSRARLGAIIGQRRKRSPGAL